MYYKQMPSEEEFHRTLVKNDPESNPWASGRSPYLYRACRPLFAMNEKLFGPTLDVSAGGGALYRGIKTYFPQLLPYMITELVDQEIVIDGEDIKCLRFDCERERLPLEDNSIGMIFFCDVLEHLLFDPVWSLIEFNRVLQPGGHLLISTPNAICIQRVLLILQGITPMSESQYKPCAVYQRHNREWTPNEVFSILKILGFTDVVYTTNYDKIEDPYPNILKLFREVKCVTIPDEDFGPEIVAIGRKEEHLTLDTCTEMDRRWPTWLYTAYETYRKRPAVLPNLVGEDLK